MLSYRGKRSDDISPEQFCHIEIRFLRMRYPQKNHPCHVEGSAATRHLLKIWSFLRGFLPLVEMTTRCFGDFSSLPTVVSLEMTTCFLVDLASPNLLFSSFVEMTGQCFGFCHHSLSTIFSWSIKLVVVVSTEDA
jgi:hypothetical protein